jgi:calcineurin-like phosphoesterase family protein
MSNRPFTDVHHMNEMIIKWWNELVAPDDTVYHLGDVALGPITESMSCIKRLAGRKRLILGNHDRPFMVAHKGQKQVDKWTKFYLAAGFESIASEGAVAIDESPALLSHFPFEGDSHDGDRFTDIRLDDVGVPLIHGHTHSNGDPVTFSSNGTKQIHVGMDAWNFRPVSERQVRELL